MTVIIINLPQTATVHRVVFRDIFQMLLYAQRPSQEFVNPANATNLFITFERSESVCKQLRQV